jgi:hypothetical protein
MIMVRREIEVGSNESSDYFLACMPQSLPSRQIELILIDMFMPLKKKLISTFIEPPYVLDIWESFEIMLEDGTKQSHTFAYLEKKTSLDPEKCCWNEATIPKEYRPQDRLREGEVLLKIINDLKAKGYHAKGENINLFFNRKIDNLLLELVKEGKSQEILTATA